jgi:hypothetical protein
MRTSEDLTGLKFGRLTAIRFVGRNKHNHRLWLWKCDCGKKIERESGPIKSGRQVSCGCYAIEQAKGRAKHGGYKTKTYKAWINMRTRCQGTHGAFSAKHYHERGISVCERWDTSFTAFLEDMGECPPGMSLERIDNSGNYEPGNCKWITQAEQTRNTRRTVRVFVGGRELCLKDACAELGLEYSCVRSRIRFQGMSPQEALSAPWQRGKKRERAKAVE